MSNPRLQSEELNTKLTRAAHLFESFTGRKAKFVTKVEYPPNPRVALDIGKVVGLIYEADMDGKLETFIHKFKKRSRPRFVVSHDGKQLYLLAGEYDFTERGIVDKTR
jgi:hypothetical protein